MMRRRPRRRPRWARLALAAALGGGPLLVGPAVSTSTAAGETPGATAWVARVVLDGTTVMEVGATAVDAVTGSADATSLAIGGQGPPRARADASTPEADASALDWTDDTGSLTVTGGYAHATSSPHRWGVRAGLGRLHSR